MRIGAPKPVNQMEEIMSLAVLRQESKDARASAGKITDAQAAQLLTLLVEDDAFRESFEADPIAALSLIGIYPEDVKSGACMTVESSHKRKN
ncbi:NHLP-related RiPP peptide [Xanthomonas sacchari]|uniref:NHLP-related RiPP peptide n=1 Tax=Xanthomonas sacchari TaxID=56458 RepID=UPI001FCA14DF|nr:NHLP-related RiPP peptide [Xanthomonas sacchari]